MRLRLPVVAGRRRRRGNTGSVTVFLHTFSGADNASSTGTADTGQTPTIPSGATFGIQSQQCYCTASTGDDVILWNTGASDGTFSVVVGAFSGTLSNWRAYIRSTDLSNRFQFVPLDASTYALYRFSPAPTQIGAWTTVAPAAGQTISFVMSGANITVKVNGTTLGTVVDSFNQTETRMGVGAGAADACRWDTLRMTVP